LSTRTHPWLADHVIAGRVLLPGTAFVELALRAGDHVGATELEELTLGSPLVLAADEHVAVQVAVGEPDGSGRRTVTVHSRADEDAPWTRHAAGLLTDNDTDSATPAAGAEPGAWPPPDAEPLDTTEVYAGLADQGYAYGPVFQGLRAAWRHGEDVLAEVALPGDATADAARFGLHPALLDAALHAADLDAPPRGEVLLPFAWTGVRLHATGAAALRVRITRREGDTLGLRLYDTTGAPVADVEAMTSLPVPDEDVLYAVRWSSHPRPTTTAPLRTAVLDGGPHPAAPSDDALAPALDALLDAPAPDAVVYRPAGPAGADAAEARTHVLATLRLLRTWQSDERASGTRLVLVTAPGSPAHAAVRGLVRSAQAENPGRYVLVEHDGLPSEAELRQVLATGEPELSLAGGRFAVPRLAAEPAAAPRPAAE
ncbi:beta-ketoacyl synthase, partial [Streptomyces sp. SID7834]